MVRAAAIQLDSTADRGRNLETTERLVHAAAADGATLVVLPERFDLRGTDQDYVTGAEPLDGPTITRMRELARELGIDVVAGSFTELREAHEKPSNTSVHIGSDGEIEAVYRKIHLFDVTVGDTAYRESASGEAGDEAVVSDKIGLTVCYDLRFPELYRILALEGALIFTVPANFTRTTGEAHWEILLRARAIENQAFVIAAAQSGEYPPGMPAYGDSMIVDPWGEILVRAPRGDRECFVTADLDFDRLREVREQLPSLANRVPAAYRWPQEVGA
jgi:deaminated glutathione amidase